MTTWQKVIKYCAIAFAFLIIASILAGVARGVNFVVNLLDEDSASVGETRIETYEAVSSLDMEIKYAEVFIKTGDEFKAETNAEYISIMQESDKLVIKEERDSWLGVNNDQQVTIYIPEDMILEKATMVTGAGTIEIESLNTNYLEMELGAGAVDVKSLNVIQEANIQGGAGKITVTSGNINDMDMELGAGKAEVSAMITGDSNFDVGVGQLDLKLNGVTEDYTFEVNKGLGDIDIDGISAEDGHVIGTGANRINLEGGIGSINVDFINNSL